jgi:hypothetical protein
MVAILLVDFEREVLKHLLMRIVVKRFELTQVITVNELNQLIVVLQF